MKQQITQSARSSVLPGFKPYARPATRSPAGQHTVVRNFVAIAAIAPVIASLFIVSDAPWHTRALAAALWILSVFPAFSYVRRDARLRRPIPFMPAISFIFGLYYVLPLVLGVTDNYYNAPVYAATDYDYPVQLAFLGWIGMAGAYLFAGLIFGRRFGTAQVAWNPRVLARWGFMLMFGAMGLSAMRSYLFNASLSGAILQFVLTIQWLGTGILIILARRGELTGAQRLALLGGFAVSTAMMLANGNIAPMVLLFAIAAFAMWIAKPHIKTSWLVAAGVALLLAISFRGIVIDFRRTLADQGMEASRSDNLTLMVGLLGRKLTEDGIGGTIAHGMVKTAGRSAIMDLFANVVRRTPSEIPYWKGDTYTTLATSMVPRFLWPDKPVKVLGQSFGHRYGFLHATNRSTAINLPYMVEFFVNFGGAGVILGMMIVGFIYRVLDTLVNRPGQSPLLSMIGVVILLPLLVIESDFSLVFGGLILTGAAFAGIWWQFRKILGTR